MNVPLAAPLATAADAGTVNAVDELLRVTLVAVGAAWLSVTVQVVLPFAATVAAAHCNDEIVITGAGAVTVTLAVFDELPSTAVRVTG